MAAFTPSGSGGIPIQTTSSGATVPTIAQVSMVLSGTEYSYAIPTTARQFLIKLRALAVLQLAYSPGDSGTTYITIPRGCFLSESDLLLAAPVTLYFQSSTAAQVAEILYWT